LAIALGLVYAGSAAYWNIAAIRGLHDTGGVGLWSDAGVQLAREVQQMDPSRQIRVIDWGLQFNLYVMLDGKLNATALDDPTSDQVTNRGNTWTDEVRKGGLFLLSGPGDREQKLPAKGFFQALAELSPVTHRYSIAERNGEVYAQFIDVEPNSHQSSTPALNVSLPMNDPSLGAHLEGFYPVEGGQWRWTQRNFAVSFDGSEPQGDEAVLKMELYVPDAVNQKLGPLTLTARLGDHPLGSATYRQGGVFTYQATLRSEWIHPGPLRIDFSLDKVLPAAAPENRELGIVVENVSVSAQ
jgi:hypothetical protein